MKEQAKDSKEIPVGDVNENAAEHTTQKKQTIALVAVIVVIIVAIILGVVLGGKDEPEPEDPYTPETINFETGVSYVSSYRVDSEITSRIARTKVSMEVANARDCSSIRTVTLQLPLGTRVAGLQVITEDEGKTCTADGVVKQIDDARETFLESASEGLPGAYVEEQNTFAHSIQVSMPPLGKAKVELVLEQLLQQRLGRVQFQLPFAPNEDVDSVSINLKVEGVNEFVASSLMLDFGDEIEVEDLVNEDNVTSLDGYSEFNLDIVDTRQYKYVPKIVTGSYVPVEFPESGVLHVSNSGSWSCFEHYFRPPDLEPLSKHVVFVVDSTMYGTKLNHTKRALKQFISSSLDEQDSFFIQLFGERPTVDAIVSSSATAEEKQRALEFIDGRWPRNDYVNFHAAFLEGILRAKNMKNKAAVTILVFISDSRYFEGERNRTKIVDHVYVANYQTEGNPVKIFVLGFEGSSDVQLLNGIAVTNDGVSASIKGPSYERQIQNFFESEFSNVLLSNVAVKYEPRAGINVTGQTIQNFPVLSDGYEVVVRGLLEEPEDSAVLVSETKLQAVTTATSTDGEQEWQVVALPSETSLCYQSYAHSRIDQLLRLRDVADLVSLETLKGMVKLTTPCPINMTFVDCIEQEATNLAITAGVVAKGITGMVTVDEEDCLSFEGVTEICRDGTSQDGEIYYPDFYEEDDHSEEGPVFANTGDGGGYYEAAGSPQQPSPVQLILLQILVVSIFFLNKIIE